MILFLNEQTLKDLGFTILQSKYDADNELVLLVAEQSSKSYPVTLHYEYDTSRHIFDLIHEDGSGIIDGIETMAQFLKLASALKF